MASTWFKQPGLPVFPPHGDPEGPSVLADLLAARPERSFVAWPQGFAGGIAHRLDTATSGALLLADDLDELATLRGLFRDGVLQKVYRFVAARRVPWDENSIERPIAHDPRHKSRMVVLRGSATPHRGRWYPAQTQFVRLRGDLWQATITTGVMHQIRAHAAFVGIPLAGDRIYGGGSLESGFLLHHVGLSGPAIATTPVPLPAWAATSPS
jgi:23S rRNA-/tRNA-specific pseudouridylate synthase